MASHGDVTMQILIFKVEQKCGSPLVLCLCRIGVLIAIQRNRKFHLRCLPDLDTDQFLLDLSLYSFNTLKICYTVYCRYCLFKDA